MSMWVWEGVIYVVCCMVTWSLMPDMIIQPTHITRTFIFSPKSADSTNPSNTNPSSSAKNEDVTLD